MTLRRALLFGIPLIAVAALGGCIGASDKCGPNMRYDSAQALCLCDETSIAVAGGCEPCAEDEIVAGASCACPPGETKDTGGLCMPVAGLGDDCDPTHPCGDATYDLCAETSIGATTCTRVCGTDTDCPAAYTCADWEDEPFCREFTGYGLACTDPAGCAGLDASVCAQGFCVVAGCTLGVEDCPRDTACCDLSAFGFGTMCIPPGACP